MMQHPERDRIPGNQDRRSCLDRIPTDNTMEDKRELTTIRLTAQVTCAG